MKKKRSRKKRRVFGFAILLSVCVLLFAVLALTAQQRRLGTQPQEVLASYMEKLREADYAGMYSMLSERSRKQISCEEFV